MSDECKAVEVPYPFFRAPFHNLDDEGQGFSDESWRPGAKVAEWHFDDDCRTWVAHGMGEMLVTPVKRVVLPGRYKPRVFFIRRWRDPDGKVFGKTTLRVTTEQAFKRMLSGYRYTYAVDQQT